MNKLDYIRDSLRRGQTQKEIAFVLHVTQQSISRMVTLHGGLPERHCKYCGKVFEPVKSQVYCTGECKRKARNSFAPGLMLNCHWCGKPFTQNHWQQKYCNKRCAIAYKNATVRCDDIDEARRRWIQRNSTREGGI